MKRTWILLFCGTFLISCGGSPKPPSEQLSKAKAVVRAADEVGAKDAPKAALHLKMARDQIAQAEFLITKEQMKKARHFLMRAEADAELSIALAKSASRKQEADEADLKVKKLRKEIK